MYNNCFKKRGKETSSQAMASSQKRAVCIAIKLIKELEIVVIAM